jgi:hypothetical protein
MLSACSALRAPKNPSRRKRLCGIFSPPHFFVPVKYFVFFLSGTKKRQLPRTLCEIGARLVGNFRKIIEKWIDKNNKI